MTKVTTFWGKHQVELTWVQASELPSHLLGDVSSSHGFCFQDDKVYLVNLDSRGWDIPGGHIENDETPLEAFDRETMEEACISGTSQMIGYILVDNTQDPYYTGKYPLVGVQVFYRMDIERVFPFAYDFESSERALVDPADIFGYLPQNAVSEAAFASALR